MPVFQARFNGRCAACGNAVERGTLISWSKREKNSTRHYDCSRPLLTRANMAPQGNEPAPAPQPQNAPEPQPQPVSQPAPAAELSKDLLASILAQAIKAARIAAQQEIANATPLSIHLTRPEHDAVKVDNAHELLPRLLYLVNARSHAYLWGPPGSGKSKAASMVAAALQLRYGYVSLNPQTPESRLLGYMDAGGNYRRTTFRDCYEHGGVFCIDELDNAHPALLNTLNGMIESGMTEGPFPDGMVKRHADFVMVATGNTNGRGGDRLFPERRALDPAFAERFTFLAWGYDLKLETALVRAIDDSQPSRDWLAFVRNVRTYCAEHGIRLWATPRAAMRGATLIRDAAGWSAGEIAEAVLFKGLDTDTVKRVLAAVPLPTLAQPAEKAVA